MTTGQEDLLSSTGTASSQARSGTFVLDPLSTLLGGWAVVCGVLASKGFRWNGPDALALGVVFLLVCLAWTGLWSHLIHNLRQRHVAGETPRSRSVAIRLPSPAALPFATAGAPAHRLAIRVGRWAERWRSAGGRTLPNRFSGGSAWLSLLVALLLAAILTLLLPPRLYILNAAFVVPLVLGALEAVRGRTSLLGRALVCVALGWLAGHLTFAQIHWPSASLSLLFAIAAWGALRCAEDRRGGLWLLDGGQTAAVVLLSALRQPLEAGVVGLLLAGQVAMQPGLRMGRNPAPVIRRTWPWLLAAMLVCSLAIP